MLRPWCNVTVKESQKEQCSAQKREFTSSISGLLLLQAEYWHWTNVELLFQEALNLRRLYYMTTWNKTKSGTPSCRIYLVKAFISSLNELHVEKHHMQNTSHLTETWRSSSVSSTEQTIRFVIVWLYLVCSQIKFLQHESRPTFLYWGLISLNNHSNPHQHFLSWLPFISELYFRPSADDRLRVNRCLALTPVLVWWETQSRHVLQWVPDAVQISQLFMVVINSVPRHEMREDIPRGENLIQPNWTLTVQTTVWFSNETVGKVLVKWIIFNFWQKRALHTYCTQEAHKLMSQQMCQWHFFFFFYCSCS